MEIVFPCGAKGREEFCPDICQYGKFCKIKEKKEQKPRGLEGLQELEEESAGEVKEVPSESEVEFYY